MTAKRTLVLGASPKPDRYSNLAVQRLLSHGHPVSAVGRRPGFIGTLPIGTAIPEDIEFDTITLYLNASNQAIHEARMLALHPKRIIFNPGAENRPFARAAEANGIEVIEGCTLVMLSAGTY